MLEQPHEQAVQPQGQVQANYGLFTILLLLALAGVTYWAFRTHGRLKELEKVVAEQGFQNDAEMKLEQARAKALREEERQKTLASIAEHEAMLTGLERTIAQAERDQTAWQKQSEALLTDDNGKRLASDETNVAAFHALRQQARPTAEEVLALRTRLEHFNTALKDARGDETTPVALGATWHDGFKELTEDAQAAARVYAEHNGQLRALMARAEAASPAEVSLAEALAAVQAQWEQESLAAVEASVAQARKEGVERLAKEKADAQRKADELEAEKVRVAGEIAAQKAQDELKKMQQEEAVRKERAAAELKRAELEARFAKALPEIRELLKPFISEGLTQPDGRQFRRGGEKGPVSLTALRRNGMLERSYEALDQLRVATTMNKTNDRPLGSFPAFSSKDWEPAVQRAQDLLNEFGELMVEKGMLAP